MEKTPTDEMEVAKEENEERKEEKKTNERKSNVI
jgi:hypothetical protein